MAVDPAVLVQVGAERPVAGLARRRLSVGGASSREVSMLATYRFAAAVPRSPGSRPTRTTGRTPKSWSFSSRMTPAWMSEVLPAPDGE